MTIPQSQVPDVHPPIPLAVSVRFERKTTLYRMLDHATDRLRDFDRMGDAAGVERMDHRHRIIFEELERREQDAAKREAKRQARMRTAAVIFAETGQVRT